MHYKVKGFLIVSFLAALSVSPLKAEDVDLLKVEELSETEFVSEPSDGVAKSLDTPAALSSSDAAMGDDFFGFDDDLPNSLDLDDSSFVEEPVLKEEVVEKKVISVPAPKERSSASSTSSAVGISGIDNELFSQMSDLEKQSALLTLQLRKEKIQNDIEAVKNQRNKAVEEELLKKEALAEKRREKAQEEQRKMLEEQQKLKEKEIELEKIRQENILKAYKDQMLVAKQAWIGQNKTLYQLVGETKKSRNDVFTDMKSKLSSVAQRAEGANTAAVAAKDANEQMIGSLQTQISVLKTRLEAEEKKGQVNPFAQQTQDDIEDVSPIKLEEVYAVMEIRGKGDKLIAKMLNKEGQSFLAQVGTSLQTGHIVDEITNTYLRADRMGKKEYIYFAAGGILDREPIGRVNKTASSSGVDLSEAPVVPSRQMSVARGLPGIAADMVIK